MGLVFAKLVLKNPRLPRLTAVKVDALADSGAVHLRIPERVRMPAPSSATVWWASPSSMVLKTISRVCSGVKGFKGSRSDDFCAGHRPVCARTCFFL